MIQSGGVLLKGSPSVLWAGSVRDWPAMALGDRWLSYGEMYRRQLWVAVLVNKRAKAAARLPLKVYERSESGRVEATGHPLAVLLRRPNTMHDPFLFWLWTVSTLDTYGEAIWGKVRDAGGRPVELMPLHPSNVRDEDRDGKTVWSYDDGRHRIENIERRDLVHFRYYNPDGLVRGMSPLEPLRATLENEDGARRANSALWRNGGRPSVYLSHPKSLSAPAQERLVAQWSDLHGGVDNWAKAAVLEEGMTANPIVLNNDELQYIEARKLNREECCAAYDVPPPVVQILDHATYSNISEQMRSIYRDTMAPLLRLLESTLETELRDGRLGRRDGEPDFGDDVYAEFLMDEVLRGDFEVRSEAYQKGVNSGWLTPAEVREKENLPFVEGSDRLLVNSTLVPLEQTGVTAAADAVVPMDAATVRTVMGRLSRQKTLAEIDETALTAGLNGHSELVLAHLAAARAANESVADLRARLAGKET